MILEKQPAILNFDDNKGNHKGLSLHFEMILGSFVGRVFCRWLFSRRGG